MWKRALPYHIDTLVKEFKSVAGNTVPDLTTSLAGSDVTALMTAASEPLFPSSVICAHSAFLACSLSFGAVPSSVTLPFSISAAHSAAPTVFVKAKRIEATGTSSSRTAATPKLNNVSTCSSLGGSLTKVQVIPCIRSLVLIDVLLLLTCIPLLQLKIPCMTRRPCPLSLQDHKHHCAHHRNKVQWQIHEIPDNRRGGELLERRLRQLPQLPHDTASTLHLPSLGDELCGVFGYEHTIEGVSQSVVDEECFAEHGEEGGGF